ncbi:uncharacterized protein CcaverHIS019_0101270 [Cutaneotrichosporon cavernicola]|uniref:Uncharacterized protein n=1 Tax=Cutaneotrichosporon cavernicola TaxID=279322 RepID=A0AA48KWQ6_9TREE|nr:uncharacterized protein CcaverHIS019_0101270 [Cutaneotrichosporon cavernicola]BEI87409.1 hypothetical protein CcaverHIS019_0101270 [Cutaneotrichosporon cavernicola]BEI95177.1 hypothetical protein CcaverHIS631_0101260 [Cutaneotrichosporon cavernicola]BEJ02951.1 hypothetical protein CcaverHIS641_0101260 [Cutaneotrichosporon cavernicola]
MSRRREEAEFQRVLQLSTQQARTFAALPPYTLSSAPSDDSRDMELRPVNPVSTGDTPLTPHRPGPRRSSYVLSPDPEESNRSPRPPNFPKAQFKLVVPARPTLQQHSPDPIDALDPSEPSEYHDIRYSSAGDIPQDYSFAFAPIVGGRVIAADDTLLSPSSGASGSVATGSGDANSSCTNSFPRSSACERNVKEKTVDMVETKRKRVGRKAKQAAADAITEAFEETPPLPTAPPPKRRAKKAKVSKTGTSQPTTRSTSQPPRNDPDETVPPVPTSSCSEHDLRDVAPRVSEAPTAAGSTTTPSGDAAPEVCDGASEATAECSKSSMTGSVISSVEPLSATEHFSPGKINPGSPVRSSPGALGKDSSSPTTAVTPQFARVLRPAHSTPPASSSTPGGGRWRTPRNDLAGVLAKFPGARRTGMSKRINIVPLHGSIGPGVKALPPPPPKSKKKVEDDEDEDEEDENGNPKIKVGSREWLMMED